MDHLSLSSAFAVWVLAFPVPRPVAPPPAPVRQLSKADEELATKKYAEAVEFGRAGKWGYDGAQGPVRQILELCSRELGKDHYLTADFRREIETLKKLAELPEAGRVEYMKTYKLYDDFEALVKKRKYADALGPVEEILDIYRRRVGPGTYYVALVALQNGHVLRACERYAQAEAQYRDALRIFRNVVGEYHPRTIDAYIYLALALNRQDLDVEAERLEKTAMEIAQRLLGDGHETTAVARNNLAGHYEKQARYTDAELLYGQALDALRAAGGEDGPRVAMARNNLAVNLGAQGRYGEAEKLLRAALVTQRKAARDDDPDVALFSGNLGVNLDDQGWHTDAEHLHRKALEIWLQTHGDSHTRTAEAYSNLAVNLDFQGRYAQAEEYLEKALRIYRGIPKGETSLGAATVHINLSSCFLGQERYAAAQAAAEKALAIIGDRLAADHPKVSAALNNLAASLNDQKKYADAEPQFRATLTAMQKKLGEDHPDTALGHSNLSVNLYYQGRFADAEPHIESALHSLQRGLGEGHPRTAWTYKNLVGNSCARGDYAKAEALTAAATASFEAARMRLGFAGLDRARRTPDICPLPGLAVAAARCKKPDLAWQALERNLARGLLDDLSAHSLTPEDRKRELAILETLNRLDQQIDDLRSRRPQTDADRKKAEKAEADRDAAQAELVQFRAGLAAKHGVTAGLVYDLKTIQKQIPDDTALVAWVDLPHVPKWRDSKGDHWACLVKHTGEPIWVHLRGTGTDGAWTDEDDRLDARARRAFGNPNADWKNLVRDFRAQRLTPLEEHLKGIGRLIVLPSSEMRRIPVEVLTDRIVSYAPSGTMFAWLRERRAAAGGKIPPRHLLAFGNPDFKKGNDEPATLPGTAQELACIGRVFHLTREFKGPEATEQNLDRLAAEEGGLRRFPYLHFATHGVLDDQRPMRSALLLAPGKTPDPLQQVLDRKTVYDGRLTAERMLRQWKLDAELVTLSACNTGLGTAAGGDGYLGFSQALFIAGARSLVVSLWEVDDKATSLLMTRFYENLMGLSESMPGGPIEPKSKAEALAEAKSWLRERTAAEVEQLGKDLHRQGTRGRVVDKAPATKAALNYEHPYYWSGFVLVGDPG